ncbi:hypothetical protein FACS1894103_4410 [Campylobacterota bacterium]|nr:hypothetical protein FACS1894103_4410 [Campylobacterota bacterium]
MNTIEGKPQIDYPCEWGYHLIGRGAGAVTVAALSAVGGRAHTLTAGHTSSKGTFVSLHLRVTVGSEEERLAIFDALRTDKAILQVL